MRLSHPRNLFLPPKQARIAAGIFHALGRWFILPVLDTETDNQGVIMKSSPKWRMRARLLLLVLGCAGAQWAIPQSAMGEQSCNLATLKGTYIFETVGFAL